jgi:plastocyanin
MKRTGRRIAFAASGAVLLLTAGFQALAATKSESIMGYAFNPSTLSVHVGDTVVWTDNEPFGTPYHTVTADGGAFGSGQLTTGQKFSFTFTKAGNFPYHCTHHTYMTGKITVIGATTSPTPTPTHTPTPTPTHTKPKSTATATAKPTVVPVSPTPTSSVKPSPRASKTSRAPAPSSTPSRVVAAASSSSSQTGVTIGLIAGALVILVGGGLLVIRKRRTVS